MALLWNLTNLQTSFVFKNVFGSQVEGSNHDKECDGEGGRGTVALATSHAFTSLVFNNNKFWQYIAQ